MKLNIVEKRLYIKSFKKLSKHYKNIQKDIDSFLDNINSQEDLGIELKSNLFKVRIANSDKNRGKSGGYRLISYLVIIKNELQLLYIYDKSKLTNLTEKEIDDIIIKQVDNI